MGGLGQAYDKPSEPRRVQCTGDSLDRMAPDRPYLNTATRRQWTLGWRL